MATRTLYLARYPKVTGRAHLAIFVPSAADAEVGTLIHVVGAPMMGFQLVFKRNYPPHDPQEACQTVPIGEIDSAYIAEDPPHITRSIDDAPKDRIEQVASQCPPPGVSKDFMAPINEVSDSL
jgi:hypothetical protein